MLLSPLIVPLLVIRSLPVPNEIAAPWMVPKLLIVVWLDPVTKTPWLIVAPAALLMPRLPPPFLLMPGLMVPLLLTLSLPLPLKVSVWLMKFELVTVCVPSPVTVRPLLRIPVLKRVKLPVPEKVKVWLMFAELVMLALPPLLMVMPLLILPPESPRFRRPMALNVID